jgi:hypothetical protein
MYYRKNSKKPATQSKKTLIKTTFLDLIAKLAEKTDDDAAILASVKQILDKCNVRLVRSLAPVRLVDSKPGLEAKRQSIAGKTRPLWA